MSNFLGTARELDSRIGDEKIRQTLSEDGPPFIFASPDPTNVGESFELAGNRFVVVRMATRKEFEHNNGRRKLNGSWCFYFFEAVTD